jgi:uncharacterized protein (TIGR02680 family)
MPSRFKPTRAGIVGLWDYTDATFGFADGRLVLRGANGSGKTKALEVLFPFVLDGRLDARRLDPFSGENRTMKDNLLWRGTDAGYGYAWLEFARPADVIISDARSADPASDTSGPPRYVTVGVGMRAQRHRPTPTSWFFVADGRVGEDLHLVVDDRPVTRKELAAQLGDDAVVDRASEHRRRVDAALFGLGPERYEAMLDLVLTLRRPMLAKDLDPRLLSETLTRGLRPLDEDLLEQVARSFDDLEAVQRDLDQLAAADDATQRFLTEYRGYLRTQARHRADAAIEAAAAHRAAVQREQTAHRALDEARAAEAMAEAEAAAAGQQLGDDRARRDALRATEAFKAHGQLEHLERSVRDLADEAARAARRHADATTAADRANQEHDAERARLAQAQADVDRLRPRVATTAPDAGIDWSTDDGDGTGAEVRRRVHGRVAARHADLDAVRTLLDAVADADRGVAAADRTVERAEEADEAATTELVVADRDIDAARDALTDAVRGWADTYPDVVDDADRDDVLAAVAAVGDDGAELPAEAWRRRLAPRRDEATTRRARLQDAAATLAEQRRVLEERRQAILDERDDAPPPLDWRGHGREQRPGAPLWQLVRFADHVAPATAAGIEAALEAAGLLDAWVRPDGQVADGATDAFLVARDALRDGDTSTLAGVLVPEDQDAVPAEVVAGLLASVPLASHGDVAVGDDGRYRLGPLAGRHRIGAPRYIGATARAAHRAARVAALDDELAALDRDADRVAGELAEVDTWLVAVDAATAALPSVAGLQERLRRRDLAAGRHQQARAALDAARAEAQTARREATDRRNALHREARTRALPADPDGIATVTQALDRFAADGTELAHTLERLSDHRDARDQAAARAATAATAADQAARELTDARRAHEARSVESRTLRGSIGADVEQVLTELEQTERAIRAGEQQTRELARRLQEAAAARGQAEGEVIAAADAVAATVGQVEQAHERLAVLTRPDLAAPLELDVPADLAADALLDAVDTLVTGVSAADERRKAAQTRVVRAFEDLQRELGAGYHAAWDVEDDVIVVTVGDDLGVRSAAGFAQHLAHQRAEQEALLTARERALFEDTLLTSVCGQIHGRIQATRDLVVTMDREMRSRRLSSGQTVGVSWRADDTATPEWKRVHRLLDQDPAHFGPDQLDELRRHFSTEIKAARAARPQTPYRELLADVLDYRRWRRFELFLVEADGSESLLTRARHARLSGGEKAASLHLPLFAAAHAAFAGARDACPRLLGLDEAFAGIDDQGRSELLSLTVAFDLDLFMTGYDLWAVDAAVPAVAHYDLLHLVDEHAVSALLVLWNGTELVEGPDADAALAGMTAP